MISAALVERQLAALGDKVDLYVGHDMTPDRIAALALDIFSCLYKKKPMTARQQQALFDSLSHLMGQVSTRKMLLKNAMRIFANWEYIDRGSEIPVWEGEQIRAVVEFQSLQRIRDIPSDCPVYAAPTKLKNGLGAGIILCTVLRETVIDKFLHAWSGCSRYKCSAPEIAGMQAQVKLRASGGQALIDEWGRTNHTREHNVQLTEARLSPTKCSRMIPCEMCSMTVSQCPLAIWTDRKKEK